MSAATAHDANPYLAGTAAANLLADLRQATDGRTGDRLSGAIRAVTKAGSTLPTDEVETAIAAIALLLAEYQPGLLDGAADEAGLRSWLSDVDTELTPGRKLAASAAIGRIALGLKNEWYDAQVEAGTLVAALTSLFRLRDALTDIG
ncbi:MAG: hypothetical protein ABJD68_11460 [Nakamurella sp.]